MDTSLQDGLNSLKDFQLTNDVSSKSSKDFGEKIARQIDMQVSGVSNYFYLRNSRIRQNRAIANGKVNMVKFQDLLEMNGQVNYTNILWKSIMMGNTLISRLVGKWMGRNEKIHVKAVDAESLIARTNAVKEAEFVLHNKELLMQLEQASGLPMVGKDQFIPEDKDDIDLWKEEWQRLPEEISTEIHVNNVLAANGYSNGGVMKEKTLHDSAETGFVGTYTYLDNKGVVHVKWVKPENAIYSYTEYPDFRDTEMRGELISYKITEIRDMFPNMPEQELFELATTAKEYQLPDKLIWINQWNTSLVRPYDGWNIDFLRFEFKSYDKDTYLITETKKNKSTLIQKGVDTSIQIADNQQLVSKGKVNIYEGLYARVAKKMITWQVKKNMIRPLDPKQLGEAEFSYSFYMYQNSDMKNVAIPEKIEEPLDQMILTRLKMQQLVAKMRPTGSAVNEDALLEVTMGLGDSTDPMDVMKVYDQTGNIFYRGRDAEGNPIPVPITELQNSGFLGQMQGLIQLYQFHYQVLKDEVGEDPNLMQAAARPRVAEGNINTAIQQADDATDYMYDAYLHVMEETATKIACLTRLSVIGEADVYRTITKQQVLNKVYTIQVQELPDDQELANLQAMLNGALQMTPDFVMYIDPFKCMRMAKDNLKLGEAYFRSCQRKMLQSKMQTAAQQSQQNAEIQAAAAQQKSQGDLALEQTKGELDIQSKKVASDGLDKNAVINGIMQMYLEQQKTGQSLPTDVQPLAQAVLKNLIIPIVVQNQQEQQQIAQAMQQQQMAQQQAAQQQQMQSQQQSEGQEQPQENAQQEQQEPQQEAA